ncbi:hypothetical protein R3P38DRAFT_2663109 [Favolaschia claudopus]|uniref:Uncharacterized protein n=1 Tax=Favolaschia claudopus TaxID=2862362 RepID=A0AAV9ZIQ8_9AGAR
MLDEIAIEQRPRWDDKTNNILGACRECSHRVSLQLNTAADLAVFCTALDDGRIHLASEATVVAFGVLDKDPRVYSPRPCCISGTDKTEKAPEHAKFIRQIIAASNNQRTRDNITYRNICVSSDGEAKRGAALVELTMGRDLDPSSPIYPSLSVLPLMNLRVGEDDLTADKDYRHVFKALRNLSMRLKGINVLGFTITPALIRQHLHSSGHSLAQLNAWLDPNDKQDVLLTYQLLHAIWSLEAPKSTSDPAFLRTREALQIFGKLAYHLVMPYIYVDLSLHQQLVHLSAAAHILFTLYSDRHAATSFMANQTYMNLMIMIKNAFFCVAKAKADNPDGEFFIILLGTDRLEILFGLIRTAIGTDSNCDIYQLSTRISNLTEASIILASRPQWDRSPRRLRLPMIINEAGEVSANADHITPASWKGDVHVANVSLLTAWVQGRQMAEDLIPQARDILSKAEAEGWDMFSPLGSSLVHYLDEDTPEEFELDPEFTPASTSEPPTLLADAPRATVSSDSSYNPDGDVEDALAIAEPQGKFSPLVEINGKMIPKARALSAMMRHRGERSSTDRLKRVAGLPSFNSMSHSSDIIGDGALGAPSLRIGNPVALVVACDEKLFLAVAQVNNLSLAGSPVPSIVLDMLVDSSAKVSVQILKLVRATIANDPSQKHDWRWSLKFEGLCSNLPGNLVHPLNPAVSILETGKPTYLFDSTTLVTMAAAIHEQMRPADFLLAPKVQRTEAFPYRNQGAACFLVEHDGVNRQPTDAPLGICSNCVPNIALDSKNGQRILEHMAGHALFDPAFNSGVQQPCGTCLRPSPMCTLFYKSRRGATATRQVDWSRSTCGRPIAFNMASAAVSKDADSPCSNIPVQCSLCDQNSPLVWTYNLEAHCREFHRRTSGPFTYRSPVRNGDFIAYEISANERKWMKQKWDSRLSKTTKTIKAKPKAPPLRISEAHKASSVALHDIIPRHTSADSMTTDEDPMFSLPPPPSFDARNPLPPIQDDEEEFGFDMPLNPAPGPIPESYPPDNTEEPEYSDASNQIDQLTADDVEIPPGTVPPGSNQFVADLDSSTSLDAGGSAGWERRLIEGQATRIGRKRRVYEAESTCDCGQILTDDERSDADVSIQCSKAGCETEWVRIYLSENWTGVDKYFQYHRACFEGVRLTKAWICPSCSQSKKMRR